MEHKIKTILVDLSGTLHIENEEIPGSVEALKRQDMKTGRGYTGDSILFFKISLYT